MAGRRKEPPKRRDSDTNYYFSTSILALLLVFIFFVSFKVDEDGEFRSISPHPPHPPHHFVLSVLFYGVTCFMVGVDLLIGLGIKFGIGVGWLLH